MMKSAQDRDYWNSTALKLIDFIKPWSSLYVLITKSELVKFQNIFIVQIIDRLSVIMYTIIIVYQHRHNNYEI